MTKAEAIRALRAIVTAITETVEEAGPEGAHAASIYMALAEHGCTAAQFEQIMGTLVEAGKLRQDCYRYFVGESK